MKRKILACLLALSIISSAAALGTFAKYKMQVITGVNTIKAANFVLSSDKLNAAGTYVQTLPVNTSAADSSHGFVEFTIKNNNAGVVTEVPMAYNVGIERTTNIPNIVFTLWKATEATEGHSNIWTYEKVTTFTEAEGADFNFQANVNEMDRYKLQWDWVGNDNDIASAGLTENFRIIVKGEQVVEDIYFARFSGGTGRTLADGTAERIYGVFKMKKDGNVYTIYDINAAGDDIVINTSNRTISIGAYSRVCNATFNVTNGYIQGVGNPNPRIDFNLYFNN